MDLHNMFNMCQVSRCHDLHNSMFTKHVLTDCLLYLAVLVYSLQSIQTALQVARGEQKLCNWKASKRFERKSGPKMAVDETEKMVLSGTFRNIKKL